VDEYWLSKQKFCEFAHILVKWWWWFSICGPYSQNNAQKAEFHSLYLWIAVAGRPVELFLISACKVMLHARWCNYVPRSRWASIRPFSAICLYWTHVLTVLWCVHRVLKKLSNLFFCQNFVKFRPIMKIFGTKIARKTSFSAVYLFSTPPNLCQCTSVLNADVPNCYVTQ